MKQLYPRIRGVRLFARPQLIRLFLLAATIFSFAPGARALNRYWVAAGAGNWSNAANWAAASGGAGGAGVPGAGDRAFFDGNGLGNCSIDIPVSITNLSVATGYTGTISQGVNAITISGTAVFGGGIFAGGSADILINGNFTISGTAFTSTSGILELDDNAAFTGGSFIHHNGTVRLNALTGNLAVSGTSPAFYILEMVGQGRNYNFTAAGNIAVSRALNISGTLSAVINTGVFDVTGDINITNTATGGGGTALIHIDGTGAQQWNGGAAEDVGALPQVTINKTGTLTLSGFPAVANSLTYTAGTLAAGASTFCFVRTNVNGYTISGVFGLGNVLFSAPTANFNLDFAAGALLTVDGTLSTDGAYRMNVNASAAGVTAIQAKGNISVGNSFAGGNGNAGILINGTGSQLFSSSVASGNGRLPFITIQKTGGTLTLQGIISVARDWTYVSGTVDAVTHASTVVFGGNALNITSNGMSFYHVSVVANTSTILNDMTVMGNLTMTGGTLAAGANTINLYGSWNSSGGNFTEATSTVNFNGSALQTIARAAGESFYNLTSNNTGTGIQLVNGIVVRNNFTMTQGNIDLNGQNITLGTSAGNKGTLAHTSGTLINAGSFTRWFSNATFADGSVTGLFPVGTATDYRPFFVGAPVNRPTTGGTMTVSYADASGNAVVSIPDGAFTVSLQKKLNWTLSTGNGLANGTYDLDVQGTGFGQIGNTGDLRLTLTGSVVGAPGTNSGFLTNPDISRTGLSLANLNNTFFIGSVNPVSTTLPVTLVSFTAMVQNGKVLLNWETSAEINNDHFTVQRSSDTKGWDDIAEIKGNGNTSTDSYYSATDPAPPAGISYYRLVQTDLDGNVHYSGIEEINISTGALLRAYPNPTTDLIVISGLKAGKHTQIEVYSAGGQRLAVPASAPGNTISLSLSALNAGIYFVSIIQGNSRETLTIAKK